MIVENKERLVARAVHIQYRVNTLEKEGCRAMAAYQIVATELFLSPKTVEADYYKKAVQKEAQIPQPGSPPNKRE